MDNDSFSTNCCLVEAKFFHHNILFRNQVQKLTDPDNPICVNQYSESPLSSTGWSSATTPAAAGSALASRETTGRSWTVAGSSLANMFPDQVFSFLK